MSGSSDEPTIPDSFIHRITEAKDRQRLGFIRTGLNPSVDGNDAHVWGVGGLQVLPTVAGTASLVSDDANDTIAGAGAQQITIYGLDSTYTQTIEVVDLDGLTPVVSSLSFLRVSRIEVTQAGSTGANLGNILITIGGNPQEAISIGDNFSHNSNYTVPAKFWLVLGEFSVAAESARDIKVRAMFSNPFINGGITKAVSISIIPAGQVIFRPLPYTRLPPATDISYIVTKLAGATGQVSLNISGYLTSDPEINSSGLSQLEAF